MYGMSGHGFAPDQFANQPMRFGEGLRVSLASKINTSPPAKPHGIAHGDVGKRDLVSTDHDRAYTGAGEKTRPADTGFRSWNSNRDR